MLSPIRRQMHRVLAAQAGKAPASRKGLPTPETGAAASEYRMMLAALGNDLRQLHDIQSVERKIEEKRTLIDRYRDWVAGALSAAEPAQDEIVTTMLVWAIDIADWPFAVEIARHVLAHGLKLPERYKRTPGTLIAEEVAESGLAPAPGVDLATLQAVDDLTELEDMPDQVRAKLKKAIGLAFKARADAFDATAESGMAGGKGALIAIAIDYLSRALKLDSGCGVKKLIEALARDARKLATEKPE